MRLSSACHAVGGPIRRVPNYEGTGSNSMLEMGLKFQIDVSQAVVGIFSCGFHLDLTTFHAQFDLVVLEVVWSQGTAQGVFGVWA